MTMRELPELPVFPAPQPARDPHTWWLSVHRLAAYPPTLAAVALELARSVAELDISWLA